MAERIILGIDFGTTSSGVSALLLGKNENDAAVDAKAENIVRITSWPYKSGMTEHKVPSVLTYDLSTGTVAPLKDSRKRSFDTFSDSIIGIESISQLRHQIPMLFQDGDNPYTSKEVRWGFDVDNSGHRLSYLKLLFNENGEMPGFISLNRMASVMLRTQRVIVDVVADYLTALRKHTMKELSSLSGKSVVKSAGIECILTVPAMWSDKAKEWTKKAAIKAGMGPNIRLISEPEAAAVYTISKEPDFALKCGQHVLVADCGGGTVDLITYRITQVRPAVKFEEVVAGTGGLCGAEFLNTEFEKCVARKFTSQAFETLRRDRPSTWAHALRDFDERHKRNFSLNDEKGSYSLIFHGVQDDADIGIEDHHLILTTADMLDIFDPVVDRVIKLCEDQVEKLQANGGKLDAIFLVGGFGQSPYLYEKIKRRFEFEHPYSIEVRRPQNAMRAVMDGALLRAVKESPIQARVYRQHLGIVVTEIFSPHLHRREQKCWDPIEEVWQAENVMSWIIPRNTKVREAQSFFVTYLITSNEPRQDIQITKLRVSTAKDAPQEFCVGSMSSIRTLCVLEADLSTVPRNNWISRIGGKGKRYYELSFGIAIRIDSAEIHCDLVVDGVTYGSVAMSFDD